MCIWPGALPAATAADAIRLAVERLGPDLDCLRKRRRAKELIDHAQ